jgi:thiol-disulfide isomerase/thioredoxin
MVPVGRAFLLMRWHLLILLCFILSSGHAQTPVKVIGQFIGANPGSFKQVTISASLIKGHEIVCPVSEFGGFTAEFETIESGFCKLSFNSFSFEFIAGKEPVLRIKITMRGDTLIDASFEDSRENAAYQLLLPLLLDQARMYSWFLNCKADTCLPRLRQEQRFYHLNQDTIAKIYPGTYTARVLCPLYDIYLADTINQLAPAVEEMLLEHTPWNMAEDYNNKHLGKVLGLYLDYAQTVSGISKQCLSAVLDKTEAGSAQRNKLANLLFDDLMRGVDDDGLKNLCELAANSQAGITDPVLLEKCKRAAKAVSGNKAPEIVLADANGKQVGLQSTAAQHRYTLLVLWSPDCPHCVAAMPTLADVYKKYRAKGLEVFAVSLGDNKKEWLDGIGKNNSRWINVQVDEKNRAQVEDYFVTFTPALILLNQQGVIVKRRMMPEALKEVFASYFK